MLTTKIELSLNTEFPSYARDAAIESAFFNCSLRAPACPDGDRKPVDIVVVLDRSGSMSGSKLDLCKKTIRFLMGELSALDRLGLVTYDTNVRTDFALTKMDEKGREQTERILTTIRAGSMTNLSGGLLAGIQGIQESTRIDKGQPNPVRSVLILTDGMANAGVTSTPKIVSLMKGLLEPNVSVFTFGYGSDHNVDMLREISEVGGGVYYFVQSVDGVSLAFADCLGGLLSVVAQNIKLECFGRNGCKIRSIKTRKTTKIIVPDEHYEIEMGDLYGEEERDILIEMSMPALPAENKEFMALECRLHYANILDSSLDKIEVYDAVQRLNEVLADQAPDSHITQQRNRIIAVEALERANAEAEVGRLEEGKEVLQEALDKLSNRMKFLSVQGTATSSALRDDLKECYGSMKNRQEFKSRGKMRMQAKVQSHWHQRSNDVEVEDDEFTEEQTSDSSSGYRNMKKKAMLNKAFQFSKAPASAPALAPALAPAPAAPVHALHRNKVTMFTNRLRPKGPTMLGQGRTQTKKCQDGMH